MTDLDELELFEHLAGTLHFGRTASECHVTPSTLSRAVSRLERETGVRLFDRDRRTVTLTADGVRLLGTVREVLAAWRGFSEPPDDEEVTGTLSLFCTVTASQTLVPDVLARFREAHPGVHLTIETGYAAEALARLAAEEVDLTVAALPPRPPRHLLTHELARTSLVPVLPRGSGIVLPTTASRAWSSVPFVLPSGGLTRTLVDGWFRRLHVRPQVAAEASGHEAVLALASLGCGVGVVPELVARQSPLAERLEVVAVDPPLPEFPIAACTRPERLAHRPTRALWESLVGSEAPAPVTRGSSGRRRPQRADRARA